jgi:3-dehydroquinate dehydratase/shikimate dehydrogenase
MEFFPKLLPKEESDHLAKAFSSHIDQNGWGFWAAALAEPPQFIGLIGLSPVSFAAPFTPAVEIGWRLAHEFWGRGFATEGALAALRYGFDILRLPEIVSFTAEQNLRSRRVMERIGMTRNPADDFDHPKLPAAHPLRRHVLYRIHKPLA